MPIFRHISPAEKKIRKNFKKTLDNEPQSEYNEVVKFEYHKNDYDEDGRNVTLSESCRVVRGSSRAFQ